MFPLAKHRGLDLEAERKIDAERQKIQEEASRRANEQYQPASCGKNAPVRQNRHGVCVRGKSSDARPGAPW
jgi:hypothetical protein